MVVLLHLAAVAKLKALAAAGHGHGAEQLLAALLGPFVLKMPANRYAPRGLGDVVFSCRLFLFRLSRIFSDDAAGGSRLARALRLVSGTVNPGRRLWGTPADEAALSDVSMMVL